MSAHFPYRNNFNYCMACANDTTTFNNAYTYAQVRFGTHPACTNIGTFAMTNFGNFTNFAILQNQCQRKGIFYGRYDYFKRLVGF